MKPLPMLAGLALAASTAFSEDVTAEGIWTWSLDGQTGQTVCEMHHSGGKITGAYTNEFGQAELQDGSLKDGHLTFKIKREKNGQPFIITYTGQLTGDKIIGTCSFEVNGQPVALDWHAKRATPAPATAGAK